MGTAALIPLAISAIGAGATAYEQNRVAQRQKEIAQERSRVQQRKQHEADAAIGGELTRMKASNEEGDRQKSFNEFMQTLMANRANAQGSGGGLPAGSSRFKEQSATTDAAIGNYGKTRADLLARIAAPGRQRQREAISRGRLQDVINGTARDAQAEDLLLQMKANATRANPWVLAAGQVAQGAGSAMAGSMAPIGPGDQLNSVIENSGTYSGLDDMARKAQRYMESGIYGGT